MTIGPDLTDDNGRLRPEVAHAIQNVPDGPLPIAREVEWPEAVGVAGPAAPAAARPLAVPEAVGEIPRRPDVRPVRPPLVPPVLNPPPAGLPVRVIPLVVPDLAAVRVSLLPLAGVVVLTALVTGLALSRFKPEVFPIVTKPSAVQPVTEQPSEAMPLAAASTPTVTVGAATVNLRSGPGIGYPVVSQLYQGEPVEIGAEQGGWCRLSSSHGASGYVFAGLLSGIGDNAHSPAVVRRLTVGGGPWRRVVLRPGQRVLRVTDADGRITAVLPDGSQLAVGEGVLIDVR